MESLVQYNRSEILAQSKTNSPEIAKHCKFVMADGERTTTYRFQTRLYRLTDMTAKIYKAKEITSAPLLIRFFSKMI